jgi:hypothetical protein
VSSSLSGFDVMQMQSSNLFLNVTIIGFFICLVTAGVFPPHEVKLTDHLRMRIKSAKAQATAAQAS